MYVTTHSATDLSTFFSSLAQPEILSELISLITTEPPKDVDEATRFKLPHVASEILSCEVPQMSYAISQDDALLEKLFAFMELEAPLNPLLASYFSKAFSVILTRKSEQVSFVQAIFTLYYTYDYYTFTELVRSSIYLCESH